MTFLFCKSQKMANLRKKVFTFSSKSQKSSVCNIFFFANHIKWPFFANEKRSKKWRDVGGSAKVTVKWCEGGGSKIGKKERRHLWTTPYIFSFFRPYKWVSSSSFPRSTFKLAFFAIIKQINIFSQVMSGV